MRKLPFLIVAGSFRRLSPRALAPGISSRPAGAQTSAKADKGELTTASIDTRAPKSNSTAPTEPPPRVQAVASRTGCRADARGSAAWRSARPSPSPSATIRTRSACHAPCEIDTTGGPGLRHVAISRLRLPAARRSRADLRRRPVAGDHAGRAQAALGAQCVQAVFFPIGKHAAWHPAVLKRVIAAGHSVGTHTWSHQNLATKTPQEAKDEIERGIGAITLMAGQPLSPVLPFPAVAPECGAEGLSRRAQHRRTSPSTSVRGLPHPQCRQAGRLGDGKA